MGHEKVPILPCAIINYTRHAFHIKDADIFILKAF